MSPIRKSLYISILILTIFSLIFMGYTFYVYVESVLASRSLEVSLLNIKIDKELSKASFNLTIYNPSNVPLRLHYIKSIFYYANKEIGIRELAFPPSPASAGALDAEGNKNITINLGLDNRSYSVVGWTLDLKILFDTSIPQRGSYRTILET